MPGESFKLPVALPQLFHDGDPYHIETSPLTCKANQWTGFYMIGTTVMKELVFLVLTVLSKLQIS